MNEFLTLLAYHFNEQFPVWYYGWEREDLIGNDLLLALICDYFDGDIAIYFGSYHDPIIDDIEYCAWLAERQKV